MSEYVEFYGDHVFLVQMIPNIAQISIFINFIKNRIFYILFSFYIKKGGIKNTVLYKNTVFLYKNTLFVYTNTVF